MKNTLRFALAVLFCVVLCLGVCVPAFADEMDSSPEEDWDQVNAAVLAAYGVSPDNVRAGYLNLVTGEEHYLNGDEYTVAASMFKVPLCMACTEKLQNGDVDWSVYEQYFSYKDVQDQVLIESSNEQANFLKDVFFGGDYNQFRIETAPYMGVEPGSERMEDTMYNEYTAREFINCLSLLYNESERFPSIVDAMQQAMTDRFFKINEPRFRIAHKPGWISEDMIFNDCAICYTTQPIALVLFTRGDSTSEEFMSAWCTAMCEYTERLANSFIVTIEGSVTSGDPNGLVGETLTADVNGEKTFFDYRFQWLRDGVEIDGATKQTYTVTPDDFEHRITCRVTAEDAKGEKTKLSINHKDIELDAFEKTIDIVDNLPEDEDDYLYGLTNGMKYSFNSTNPKDREYVDNKLVTINGVKAFPFFEQGTYRFYDTEGTIEQGSLIAIVEVRNWWSLSYRVTTSSSSSSSSSSGGTVRMYNGATQLTGTSRVTDKNGNLIIQGTGITSWLVREGANTDLKVVVTPSIGSYGHVSLNSGDYSSSVGERTIPVSPITEPMRFEIVFSREANYPPVPIAAIDEQNFPDPAFRQYVSTNVDRDGDGLLYDSEISIIRNVSVSNMGIGSLKGIEYFTALQYLYCANNSLTSLDILDCPMLTYLSCKGNALTSLDLSGCPALSTLYCSDNVLTELDLSVCPVLTDLQCSGNLLISINLSRNPQLRTLNCYDNLLGSLELDSNPALSSLYCQGNLLTELDLNGKTALTSLNCYGNLLSWLDVSGCARLRTLNCEGNELAALDLSGCEALSTLNCYGNMLSELDLNDCTSLRRLSCANNSLTSLNVSGYSLLTTLTCQSNHLEELHVKNCPALKALTCQRNALTELDLGGCDALLTLIQNVNPVVTGGVVSYGVNSSGSAILSFDEGVLTNAIPDPALTFPAALAAIGSEAFAGGAFDSVYIPDSVTFIAQDAFGDRTSLTIIGVPGSTAEVFAQAHGFDFVPAA